MDSVSCQLTRFLNAAGLMVPLQAVYGVQQRKSPARSESFVKADTLNISVRTQATSLPLLLLESLGNTGTLKQLMRDGESIDEVLNRGRVSGAWRSMARE